MVTMRDVAAKVGVSQATVSYALRGDPSISEKTRQKVLEAAQTMNYSTNLSARSLKSGRSNAIGLVLQDLGNPYSTCMANAFSTYALQHGLQIVVQQTMYQQANETSILEHVASAFCDAVIFSPTIISSSRIIQQLAGKPAVLLSPSETAPELDSIVMPCLESTFISTSYLISRGCRRLLFLGTTYVPYEQAAISPNTGTQRMAGFEQALLRNGFQPKPQQFSLCQWTPQDGYRLITALISQGLTFDGVVCGNDALALGVMRGIQDRGLRIPEDVSVIGFDGINEGAFSNPTLSTIAFDFDDIAHQAIDTILAQLNGDDEPPVGKRAPKRLITKCRLVVRGSTR